MSSAAILLGALRVKLFSGPGVTEAMRLQLSYLCSIFLMGKLGFKAEMKAFETTVLYLFGYKTSFSPPKMTTNNNISPMEFCCNTSFTFP